MNDGYQVEPGALQETALGIQGAIDALKGLGFGQSADVGRGFSGLELTGMQTGDAELRQALDGFCERWSWGVRTLVQDGNEIASRLGLSAGLYHDQEQYLDGVLKDTVAADLGNPGQSDAVTEKQSWGKIWGDNPVSDVLHPDYSAASNAKAEQTIARTWEGEQKDLTQLGEDALGGPTVTAVNSVHNALHPDSPKSGAGVSR